MSILNITLAVTWIPRGEQERLVSALPQLLAEYTSLVIVVPAIVYDEACLVFPTLKDQEGNKKPVYFMSSPEWSWGRNLAIKESLNLETDFIHYADLDRLLRWIELNSDEWKRTLRVIPNWDYLIIGRSQVALDTHPRAIVETEDLSNRIASFFVGSAVDVSAGSKGLSRQAAEFLVNKTKPGNAFGADAEWSILLHRRGYRIGSNLVDGLDWETADRYQGRVANAVQQQTAAISYDSDPKNWSFRIGVAGEIIERALSAAHQPIEPLVRQDFDFEQTFEVSDYMYFYEDMLSPEKTSLQINLLVRELELDKPKTILDLACGFGRHANQLAKIGHKIIGIDYTAGFLEIARQCAAEEWVWVDYRQGDMRELDFNSEFDCVLLLFTAFGYFEDAMNERVMQKISQALKPGGRLVFDIQNRDTFIKGFVPAHVTEKNGNLMIDRPQFDSETGRLFNHRIVIREGMRRDKPFFVRMYNPSEIRTVLTQAGMEIVGLFGGWDGTPISPESTRMVIIAKKV